MSFKEIFRQPTIFEKQKEEELNNLKQAIAELKENKNAYLLNKVSPGNTTQKKEEITIKQQILILDYLGAFQKINEVEHATKKAAFLELLFNKNGQNIRDELGSIHELKSSTLKSKKAKIKENLEKVSEIFKTLGLKNIVKKVEIDIEKLDG